MENPEEILHCLEEFAKLKPKDIPRELEEYLCFVAKTGDPVYQWSLIKSLFREKLINVITEFYESCPSVDIPPCPNVDIFNYDTMKSFILEKLDTFVAAPFTVQRICELLTTPRKEYNRIDKYMRALEKNILVVSTTEPGNHRTPENGDGFVNGVESDHIQDGMNDINIEEMDDAPVWPIKASPESMSLQSTSKNDMVIDTFTNESNSEAINSNIETVITCCTTEEQSYVSIEPVNTDTTREESAAQDSDVSVTITAIPAAVQKRRDSIEPPNEQLNIEEPAAETIDESTNTESKETEEINVCSKSLPTEPIITESSENVTETSELLNEDSNIEPVLATTNIIQEPNIIEPPTPKISEEPEMPALEEKLPEIEETKETIEEPDKIDIVLPNTSTELIAKTSEVSQTTELTEEVKIIETVPIEETPSPEKIEPTVPTSEKEVVVENKVSETIETKLDDAIVTEPKEAESASTTEVVVAAPEIIPTNLDTPEILETPMEVDTSEITSTETAETNTVLTENQ